MVKAKLVYYNEGEVVKVIRGNYSGERDCCGTSGRGARTKFEIASERILNNLSGDYYPAADFEYDCVELYKRNRAGVPRRLVATISMPKIAVATTTNDAKDKISDFSKAISVLRGQGIGVTVENSTNNVQVATIEGEGITGGFAKGIKGLLITKEL